MQTKQPAGENVSPFSALPDGYTALGNAKLVTKASSKVRFCSDSALVEVTALADDLFRVGLFPHGRSVCYPSEAVVARDWEPTNVKLQVDDDEVLITTPVARACLSLDPFRISFTDQTGRTFAADDATYGMGWFAQPEAMPSTTILNPVGTLGTPARVYKQSSTEAHYFGCGERTGNLDKSGTHQIFWNIDPPAGHSALQNNLYVSIPFTLVLENGQAWGLFLDSTARTDFDLACENPERSWFGTSNGDLIYYVFCGPTPQSVLARYTELTGRTPLPPLWGLGNGQSRFSYESAAEVRAIARRFRELDIPCDTLYFDIDTLDGYRVFTWNRENFPDMEGLLTELRDQGFHVVCIVDAGVKVDEKYAVYTEGLEHDFYCKNVYGGIYQNAVWPGICVFPDFTNSAVRVWWGNLHQSLLDAGISGIWSDMNEPALFVPLNSTMPGDVVHPGDGDARMHAQVHNAYGSLMVQAAREGLLRLRPEQRPFVISRSGYAGVQRHALIWTGDNSSTWEHLAMSVAQLQNLGISGVSWSGADIGGFYGDTTGELLTRWTEFGIFQPFCRNHSEKQTRHQEPWLFEERHTAICRDMLKLRQQLIPYLYSLFDECNRTGAPLLRPLFWADPADTDTYGADDEVLCGDALLVAPITRPGAEFRHVYLPTGTWFHFWTDQRLEGCAHILAHAPLGQPAFYIRANTAIPFGPAMNYVGEKTSDPLTLILYPCEGYGQATLYEDAGDGYEQLHGVYGRRLITCIGQNGNIQITIGKQDGTFLPARHKLILELRAATKQPDKIQLGSSFEEPPWTYDAAQNRLRLELPSTADEQIILIENLL